MTKRHPPYPSDLSHQFHDPSLLDDSASEQADTVLMSGAGSEEVFDDLRQRYERQVESKESQLMGRSSSGPAPLVLDQDANSELSIEPAPRRPPEPEVPLYAWLLVGASFVLLLTTGAVVLMLFV